jgi:hypothetical protein
MTNKRLHQTSLLDLLIFGILALNLHTSCFALDSSGDSVITPIGWDCVSGKFRQFLGMPVENLERMLGHGFERYNDVVAKRQGILYCISESRERGFVDRTYIGFDIESGKVQSCKVFSARVAKYGL